MTIFISFFNLLIPCIMIVVGLLFLKKPPRKINGIYGYRTSMSTKNQDTWNFAHYACGKIWFKVGCIMLIITLLFILFLFKMNISIVTTAGFVFCIIQSIILIATIYPVEKELKKHFDKEGNPK